MISKKKLKNRFFNDTFLDEFRLREINNSVITTRPIASPHAILIFSAKRVVVFYFSSTLCFFKTVVVLKLNIDSEIRLVELLLNSNRSNFPDSVLVTCCRVPSPPKLLNPTKNYRSERPNLQFQDENVFYSHVLSFAKTRQIIGNSVFH